jgi:hypothetical protein
MVKMSQFNEFYAPIECPYCGDNVKVRFQANIGALDLKVFNLSEQVVDIPAELAPSIFGEGPEEHNIDFWAYGMGDCPVCKHYLWVKVNIRSKRFESVTLINDIPIDMYGWGLL